MQIAHAASNALRSVWPRGGSNQCFCQGNVMLFQTVSLQVFYQVVVPIEFATAPLAGNQLGFLRMYAKQVNGEGFLFIKDPFALGTFKRLIL